jgi:hypothetical protein
MSEFGDAGGESARASIVADMRNRIEPERRRVKESDVPRFPEPDEKPDPRVQWDEVEGRWEIWDESLERWVGWDDVAEGSSIHRDPS